MAQFKKKRTYLAILLLGVVLVGCKSAPILQKGESLESFSRRDCMYRNEKNPSVCAVEGEEYRKSMQEKRTRNRLEYCENKKFKNMTSNECRLFLNQK